MKRISLLGSTGSIGVSTLDVVGAHPDQFVVTALAAGRNITLMKQQIERFRPRLAAMIDEAHAGELRRLLGPASVTDVLSGPEGYRETAAFADADMVVSAMVGAAGLLPTLDAIEAKFGIPIIYTSTIQDLATERAASWLSKHFTYWWLEKEGHGRVLIDSDRL